MSTTDESRRTATTRTFAPACAKLVEHDALVQAVARLRTRAAPRSRRGRSSRPRIAGCSKPVRQLTVVGEQQHAGSSRSRAGPPARRARALREADRRRCDALADRASSSRRPAACAQNVGALGCAIRRVAVHLTDRRRRATIVPSSRRPSVDANCAARDQVVGTPSRGYAGLREIFVESHASHQLTSLWIERAEPSLAERVGRQARAKRMAKRTNGS